MMPRRSLPGQVDLSATQNLTRNLERLATKKIWLPKLLYDSLPWFYLAAGLAAFFAALYVSEWFWVVPHYVLFSAACLHLAFAVYRRRRPAQQDVAAGIDDTVVFHASQTDT